MILFKKDKQIKILLLFIIVFVNYLCLWYVFSLLEINGIQPIGFKDSFGFVFPPYWFALVIGLFSCAEFIALTAFFPFGSKSIKR